MVTTLSGFVAPDHGGSAGHGHRRAGAAADGSWPGAALRLPGPVDRAWGYQEAARYCPMLAIDIAAFNDRRRGEDVQRFLRAAMYELLARAFDSSRLTWLACYHEDRGDGILVVAPPATPAIALFDPLVDRLRAGLRLHNKICSDLAKIRLRMSVHAGQVHFDENGICGFAVNHLFRMLDAAAFKRTFAASGADFGLVTSDVLYEDVISQGPGLVDPGMYAPINIRCKETRGRAWLYLPPVRNPFLGAMTGKARQAGSPAEAGVASPAPAQQEAPEYGTPDYGTELPAPITLQRRPRPQDARGKDLVPALAGLIAAGAATRSRWLASVPRSSPVPGRIRDRLHPGQRAPHFGR